MAIDQVQVVMAKC